MKRAILILLASTSIANAQTNSIFLCNSYPCQQIDPPLNISTNKTITIFEMKDGACLKGPLAIYNHDGKEMFRLDKNADYPTGCMKK